MDQATVCATVAAACEEHARRVGLLPDHIDLADAHPALSCFADPRYNPGAGQVADVDQTLFQHLRHHQDGTYYLADLYQSLSVEAVKTRAFCQTPEFVTDLLMTCTWENAVDELDREPYPEMPSPLPLRAIDPACGGGHILVELLGAAMVASQHRDRETMVRDALAVVHGVDLDPFAVAVARFRLLTIACSWLQCRFDEAPTDLPIQVAAGNSLLAGTPHLAAITDAPHTDLDDFPRILDTGRYDVVLANPPYVTPKEATMRDAVRAAYPQVCHGKYALSVPFEPLFHRLAKPGGWVARLTANSFMKREFGKPLIEDYFPTIDLQWVIDTSGAYIPGHGTPTVILVSRNRPPTGSTVRAVLGVRGEPSAPARPAAGVVWSAIRDAVGGYERDRRAAAAMRRAEWECLTDEERTADLLEAQTKVDAPAVAPLAGPRPASRRLPKGSPVEMAELSRVGQIALWDDVA